jgi:hypothetical protein
MLNSKLVRLACATAIVAGCSATIVRAQLADRRTIFTFSGPVAIPGATLPAGRYVFRLADPGTSARVVQVFSADGKKPYAMFFSHPAERLDAASKPEVRFLETAKGEPAAIKTWWYPGERTGFEFVYPKDQARRLARGSKESVLTTQAQSSTTAQTNTSNLARVSPTGEETSVNTPPNTAPTGTPQEGAVADASIAFPPDAAAPVQTDTVARNNARTGLPTTASSVPPVGLFGLIAIAGAAALRFRRTAEAPRSID